MKKKIIVLTIFLLLVSSVSVFSLGLGAAFGLDGLGSGTPGGNIMLSAKLDQLPFVLGLSYNLESPFTIGVTADWQMVRQPLVNFINIYAGPGAFFAFTNSAEASIEAGLRVPVALYIFPVDFLECFLEIAPAFSFIPTIDLDFQTAVGFRFWF